MSKIGVAISTTGDDHRMRFLETCVEGWRTHLPLGSVLVVTVDGTEENADSAYWVSDPSKFGNVYRVGQGRETRDGRQGVAVNKNTGLELLMDMGCTDLFLCDDDTWPTADWAITKHLELSVPHSMVCWGASRWTGIHGDYATWSWPRGVLLHATRSVVETVGGFIEEFGPGGHEHVEWSRRIHQAGLTPAMFCSPRVYAEMGPLGRATRASMFWNAEDMRKRGESFATHRIRRGGLTSVRRTPNDWPGIEKIMADRDGDTSFVPFRAHENGRTSATLCSTSTGRGAGGAQ